MSNTLNKEKENIDKRFTQSKNRKSLTCIPKRLFPYVAEKKASGSEYRKPPYWSVAVHKSKKTGVSFLKLNQKYQFRISRR